MVDSDTYAKLLQIFCLHLSVRVLQFNLTRRSDDMNDITYIDVYGFSLVQCKVRLGKKTIGAIYKTGNGEFYYRPTGSSAGDHFSDLDAVKRSLETN